MNSSFACNAAPKPVANATGSLLPRTVSALVAYATANPARAFLEFTEAEKEAVVGTDAKETPFITIYTLSDPRTGEVRYVGKTQQGLKRRLCDHLKEKSRLHKNNWITSLRRQGISPAIESLEILSGETDDHWQQVEQFWIETMRFYGCRLTNMDSGGRNGKRFSVDAKNKLRAAKLKQSPETRELNRLAHAGLKLSRATCEKIRAYHLNITPEQRAARSEKMSAAQKLRWVENRSAMLAIVRKRDAKNWSAESRAKISAAHKGKKVSGQALQNMRNAALARRGLKFTGQKLENIRAGVASRKRSAAYSNLEWKAAHSARIKAGLAKKVGGGS